MAQALTDAETTGGLSSRGIIRRRHSGPQHSLRRASGPSQPLTEGEESRWTARPGLARVVRVSVVLALIGSAVGSAYLVSTVLPLWGGWARIPRGLLLVAVSTVVFYGVDKLARRVMPLAMLLELSLCFPDQLPSRFALALRGARVRDMDVATAEAVACPPGTAAEALTRCIVLLGALTTHDRRTRGHCERVRALSDLLASQVGLSAENRDRMRWAALLHDIGKLHVDHDLLNKVGIPTPAEWEVLRAHPTVGAVMVEPLREWLGDCVDAIGHHHERWDGQGYPAGLVGRQISFAGRLIAVVDAYEVMTAPRSYKRPVNAKAARRELVRCAGTHFDPMMVRSFLNISLGDLRRSLGPMAWVGDVPLLGRTPRYEGSLAAVGRQLAATATSATGATAVAVTTAVTLGPLAATALANTASPGHSHSNDGTEQVLASGLAGTHDGGHPSDTKVLGTSFSPTRHAPSTGGAVSTQTMPTRSGPTGLGSGTGGITAPGSQPPSGPGASGLVTDQQAGASDGGTVIAQSNTSSQGEGGSGSNAFGLQGTNGSAFGHQGGGNGNGNAFGHQGGGNGNGNGNGSAFGHQGGGNGNGNAFGHQGGGNGNGNGNGSASGHQGGGNGNASGNQGGGNGNGNGSASGHQGGGNGNGSASGHQGGGNGNGSASGHQGGGNGNGQRGAGGNAGSGNNQAGGNGSAGSHQSGDGSAQPPSGNPNGGGKGGGNGGAGAAPTAGHQQPTPAGPQGATPPARPQGPAAGTDPHPAPGPGKVRPAATTTEPAGHSAGPAAKTPPPAPSVNPKPAPPAPAPHVKTPAPKPVPPAPKPAPQKTPHALPAA